MLLASTIMASGAIVLYSGYIYVFQPIAVPEVSWATGSCFVPGPRVRRILLRRRRIRSSWQIRLIVAFTLLATHGWAVAVLRAERRLWGLSVCVVAELSPAAPRGCIDRRRERVDARDRGSASTWTQSFRIGASHHTRCSEGLAGRIVHVAHSRGCFWVLDGTCLEWREVVSRALRVFGENLWIAPALRACLL